MMRKIPGLFILMCVCLAAILNSGTVRRKQSAVLKAQTAGIKLKDKLEELKDGEKGPATPSFGWYGGKNGFMSDPPYNKDKPASAAAAVPLTSEVELPSQQQGSSAEGASPEGAETGWDEDWADEGVKEDEALPAKDDTEEAVDQPEEAAAAASKTDTSKADTADTSGDEKASKWDKDWWDEI